MTSIYTKTKKTSVNTEVNEKSSIVVRLLRQPGRNAFTTSESIYDLYSKHENYKDSTSKSKEIHFLPISEKNVGSLGVVKNIEFKIVAYLPRFFMLIFVKFYVFVYRILLYSVI